MAKPLSFKDFIVVDYKPGEHEIVKYAAHKRHRGRIGEETTDEALTFSQRRARGRVMKKNKAKIAMGRRRAAKKPADNARLQKRAQKQARMQMFKKLTKGAGKEEVPAARRASIEKRLDKMKPKIAKIARKILPAVRKTEKERRVSKSSNGQK
jgi:hypothetical protein